MCCMYGCGGRGYWIPFRFRLVLSYVKHQRVELIFIPFFSRRFIVHECLVEREPYMSSQWAR
jgi:hypothetical protein